METPLVSCLMPTRNRRIFVPQAITYFQRQDYPNRELIILDDGDDAIVDLIPPDPRVRYARLTDACRLGAKRNFACEVAAGSILAHWDDDDWYAPWRLRYQVSAMLQMGVPLSGCPRILFYQPTARRAWRYDYPASGRAWLAGASLCYSRALWERNPFADVDIGEDALFAQRCAPYGVHVPANPYFCVAIIHGGNAAPKIPSDRGWQPYPLPQLLELLGPDQGFYATLPQPPAPPPAPNPLVSCITPTFNRRAFVERSIRYFIAQDYAPREMIIVDDGSDPVGDLAGVDPRIRYVRLNERHSIGAKRNRACEVARGEVVVQWDDDDWNGPTRLSHQVADIAAGRADVTGLGHGLLLDLRTGHFWSCREDLHARMFFQSQSIHGGTLAFARSTWERCGGYPDESLAEDAAFLTRAIRHGARVTALPNAGTFVYVRHDTNSWRFDVGGFGGPDGWRQVPSPAFFPDIDLAFYQSRSHAETRV